MYIYGNSCDQNSNNRKLHKHILTGSTEHCMIYCMQILDNTCDPNSTNEVQVLYLHRKKTVCKGRGSSTI